MADYHLKGAIVSGKIQRDRAIKKYYNNANLCLYCSKIIRVGKGQKVSEVRAKKFCNRTCAATYNNNKRIPQNRVYVCQRCRKEFPRKRSKTTGLLLAKRKYCEMCTKLLKAKAILERHGLENDSPIFGERTKEQVYKDRNYTTARNAIARHARIVYLDNTQKPKCEICGYNLHVETAHKIPVAKFPKGALIKEINHISNLVGLCPNHHWEYDNNLVNLNNRSLVQIQPPLP